MNIVHKIMSTQSKPTKKANPASVSTEVVEGRRERKLQQTIAHIGSVAWKLFETRGFDAVTMEAIAEAADVAKGTLYKHFPVKEALIGHQFEKNAAERRDAIIAAVMLLPSCSERLARLAQEESSYLTTMRGYLAAYMHYRFANSLSSNSSGISSGMEQFVAVLLKMGQASGEIANDLSAESMAANFQFLRLLCLMRWLKNPEIALADLQKETLHLFLHGALKKLPT